MNTAAGTSETMSLDDIKRHVEAAFTDFVSADAKRVMAKADADNAADSALGTRERQLTRLAGMAHKAGWSDDDVSDAIDAAIAKYAGNYEKKSSSLATFKSDVKLACHRKVRGRVASTFATVRAAWDAETEALSGDDDAPKPLRKAFARQYHASVAALKAIRDNGNVAFDDAAAIVQFAVDTIRAREINYDRVLKRLKSIRAELGAFYDDFPDDGIQVCLEYLNAIDKEDLKKARALATAGDETEDAPETAPEPEPEDAAPETVEEGVTDALRDLYGEAA